MAYADSTAIIYSGSNHIMQYAYDVIAINQTMFEKVGNPLLVSCNSWVRLRSMIRYYTNPYGVTVICGIKWRPGLYG